MQVKARDGRKRACALGGLAHVFHVSKPVPFRLRRQAPEHVFFRTRDEKTLAIDRKRVDARAVGVELGKRRVVQLRSIPLAHQDRIVGVPRHAVAIDQHAVMCCGFCENDLVIERVRRDVLNHGGSNAWELSFRPCYFVLARTAAHFSRERLEAPCSAHMPRLN